MSENHTKGELHGCVVCGKLYDLYVVYNGQGRFIGCKVMTPGGKVVRNDFRPLVACERHSRREIEIAVERAYGSQDEHDE